MSHGEYQRHVSRKPREASCTCSQYLVGKKPGEASFCPACSLKLTGSVMTNTVFTLKAIHRAKVARHGKDEVNIDGN